MVQRSAQQSTWRSPLQWPTGPMPNRAYLKLSVSKTDTIRQGIALTTATGAHLEHIHTCIENTRGTTPTNPSPPRRHTPCRPFPAAHCPCPQCQCQRMAHWGLGVRAVARESPGQPLGPPPSQGPPRRVVPDEAAALRSRTSPGPRVRQPPE